MFERIGQWTRTKKLGAMLVPVNLLGTTLYAGVPAFDSALDLISYLVALLPMLVFLGLPQIGLFAAMRFTRSMTVQWIIVAASVISAIVYLILMAQVDLSSSSTAAVAFPFISFTITAVVLPIAALLLFMTRNFDDG